MFHVRNIKVSVKIKRESLDNVILLLNKKNVPNTRFLNFVTFTKQFSFVLFKTSKDNLNHVNITKIPSLGVVTSAIKIFKKIIECSIEKVQIDNIIATSDFNKEISLRKIVEKRLFQNIKFNIEQFPGLFIKLKKGTVIVFHTGKIVIVGCKKYRHIKCLIQTVFAHI